jgi:phenylacetic acid degradation operon negative regulatory protein
MPRSAGPRSIVLNLLRVATERAIPVSTLVQACEVFGFAANSARVAITRLLAEGLVESDERGLYRLGAAAQAMGALVEEWRRGEARMRRWRSDWLAAAPAARAERTQRRHALRALTRLSFRDGGCGLWVRPDNLAEPLAATRKRLQALGLTEDAELFRVSEPSERLLRTWSELWPVRQLQQGYARALHDLRRSLAALARLPEPQALVQTFVVGGRAIRVLATDPLLPPQIMPAEPRAELTELMRQYDRVGHQIWRDAVLRGAPTPARRALHVH